MSGIDSEEWEDDFIEDADHLEESKEAAMTDREEKEENLEAVAGELAMGNEHNQVLEEPTEQIDAAETEATIQ